jgi:hypothetical protein
LATAGTHGLPDGEIVVSLLGATGVSVTVAPEKSHEPV